MKRHYKPEPYVDNDMEPTPEMDDLDFSDNQPIPPVGEPLPAGKREVFQSPQRTREAGLTEASQPGAGPTADDMSPETLINEDGARSPAEVGENRANDERLRTVRARDIGGGLGLDEAEIARTRPLDGEPWDGDPDSSLQPQAAAGDNFPASDGDEDDDEDEDWEEE